MKTGSIPIRLFLRGVHRRAVLTAVIISLAVVAPAGVVLLRYTAKNSANAVINAQKGYFLHLLAAGDLIEIHRHFNSIVSSGPVNRIVLKDARGSLLADIERADFRRSIIQFTDQEGIRASGSQQYEIIWSYDFPISHFWVFSGFCFLIAVVFVMTLRRGLVFAGDQIIAPVEALSEAMGALDLSAPELSPFRQAMGHRLAELDNAEARFSELLDRIAAFEFRIKEIAKGEATVNVATQVSHDIRSPLAALAMIDEDPGNLPEDTRLLIRSAVSRIRDIANHLLETNRRCAADSSVGDAEAGAATHPQLLSSVIDSLLTEKRLEFRSRTGVEIERRFDSSTYGLFASIQLVEFKRLLSNLVNNGVEALGSCGTVRVSLESISGDWVQIRVQDDGKGIPGEIVSRLGRPGASFGKEGGSALGLYHARSSVESWGGTLQIESAPGRGTTILLRLPRADAPEWFGGRIRVERQSLLVVLDDDESIHRIWSGRFESERLSEHGVKLVHFREPSELRKWKSDLQPDAACSIVYLFDYELLGCTETGLDLVEELAISAQTLLVTSRYEEAGVRERCMSLGVRLIPKGIAGFVPFEITDSWVKYDGVLLDDDPLVRLTWATMAKNRGRKLLVFDEVDSFWKGIVNVDRATPIYIDSNLPEGVRGRDMVPRIASLGFKSIFLQTGYDPRVVSDVAGLAGILGKSPPF